MLRDNLVGLIEPMLSSAGANPLALCTARQKPSDDRPPCLENPRPEGAESTLTENTPSPFHAEPRQIDDGFIVEGSAPSYYIEGLLYNVPNDQFVGDYQDISLNILNWLYNTKNRSEFVCANEQYYLLRDNTHTCWACADGNNFINAAIKLWNEW